MIDYNGEGRGFYAGYGCGPYLSGARLSRGDKFYYGDGHGFGDNYGDGYGDGYGEGPLSRLFDVRIVNTDLEGAVYYTLITGGGRCANK